MRQPATDEEGYLVSLEDWTPQVAELLAEQEGIELTPEHWELIETLRAFYQTFEQAPSMRPLVKWVSQRLGPEKGRSIYLMKLFPPSPAKLGCKIAGLPRPHHCI